MISLSRFQFFNSPGGTNTNEALTSTPVCTRTQAHTPTVKSYPHDTTNEHQLSTPKVRREPNTPSGKGSLLHTPTAQTHADKIPRTPTPFKNALAYLEKKSGVVRTEVGTHGHQFRLGVAINNIIYLFVNIYFAISHNHHCMLVN